MFLSRCSHFYCRFYSTKLSASLAYDQYGSEKDRKTKPLIIGHGLFGSKRNWKSLAKALQRELGNQVYIIDFRNHGDSPHFEQHLYSAMSEDLSRFMEDLRIKTKFESFHLLGHSMGGKAMAHFAVTDDKAEKLIEKLIIEDISPSRPTKDSEIPRYLRAMKGVDLSKSRKEIEDELKIDVPDFGIRQFLMMNLIRNEENPNFWCWKVNLDAIERSLEHIFEFTTSGSFNKPTLFITGQNSPYIRVDDHEPISRIFPKSSLVVIPNAGHWVHVEQPKLFVDCVVQFLR